jgi:hypothetical protein
MVTHLKQFCGIQQGAVELATTGAFLFFWDKYYYKFVTK